MIRVMVVDDQRLVREGLQTMIEMEEDLLWVGEANDGRMALDVARQVRPDVILMDIRMPECDGVEATRLIREWNRDVKVLILTTFNDDQYVIQALREGGKGYLLKDIPAEELFEKIRTVYNGGAVMPPDIASTFLEHIQSGADFKSPSSADAQEKIVNASPLTAREKEVVYWVGQGYSNHEIAEKLFISEGTVKNHVSHIMHKLQLRERTHIAIFALTGQKPKI